MQHRLEMTAADSAAPAAPRGAVVTRDRLMQLEPSRLFVGAKLVDERELVASPCAVQERNSS